MARRSDRPPVPAGPHDPVPDRSLAPHELHQKAIPVLNQLERIASPGRRPVRVDGSTPQPPVRTEDRARVERMIDAVRRLGDQFETTQWTFDEFVERLSDAAREEQAAAAPTAGCPAEGAGSRPA